MRQNFHSMQSTWYELFYILDWLPCFPPPSGWFTTWTHQCWLGFPGLSCWSPWQTTWCPASHPHSSAPISGEIKVTAVWGKNVINIPFDNALHLIGQIHWSFFFNGNIRLHDMKMAWTTSTVCKKGLTGVQHTHTHTLLGVLASWQTFFVRWQSECRLMKGVHHADMT